MTITETENPKPLVCFEHIEKSFDGETLVIKDLNLEISQGEFLTLLGPSGSGKTTMLMMLAGFEIPTHGEIYLDSQPIGNIPPHKRNIGMVFQIFADRHVGKEGIILKNHTDVALVRWNVADGLFIQVDLSVGWDFETGQHH